jgi:exosortase E/protease (VPEID-CTERM system)
MSPRRQPGRIGFGQHHAPEPKVMAPGDAAIYRRSTASTRLLLFTVLAGGEMLAISLLFTGDLSPTVLRGVQYYVRQLVLLCVAGALAFVVVSWPKRHDLIATWVEHVTPVSWRLPLAVNLTLFAFLAMSTIAFSRYVGTVSEPPWGVYCAYLVLLATAGVSLMWVAAPLSAWRSLLERHRIEVAMAAGVGLIALLAGVMTQAGWSELAQFTLRASYRILSLYEADVQIDSTMHMLGVGDFNVFIDDSCSGYEGIGLVSVFLGLFLWAFRRALRFPNAFLLLPIGIGTIWLLNSVRIAALVSIGAHFSPAVAISGFHSQAGWIAFLTVTIGIMATAPRLAFFAIEQPPDTSHRAAGDRTIQALLVPFMALMAASIVMAAFAPYDTWLYGLKVVAVGSCLWFFWDIVSGFIARPSPFAFACGIVVGTLWVATAPTGQASDLGAWIMAQPIWLAVVWLTLRATGSIILVPVAEELAFRGLLYRWLISRQWETLDPARLSLPALAISSLLFGLMHQRWIGGALAGAAFAVAMLRSGRLSDAIAAHIAANAIIMGWAVAARQWSLL